MPFTIKASLFFQDSGNGWTESFFWQQATRDLSATAGVGAYSLLDNLSTKRALLLGADSWIKGQRVSVEVDDLGQPVLRDSFLGRIKKYGPSIIVSAKETNGSAKPGVGLNLTWHNALATRHRNQFMRGIPDEVEGPSGDRNEGWANWMTSFLSWRAAMLASPTQTGWLGANLTTTMSITNYTVDPLTNLVLFTVAAGPVTPPPLPPGVTSPAAFLPTQIGIPLLVTISGLNQTSNLNGSLRVVPTSTTTCRSYAPVAVVPFVSAGKMKYISKQFIPAADCSLEEIMYRSAGSPLLQPRGRKKNRVRA